MRIFFLASTFALAATTALWGCGSDDIDISTGGSGGASHHGSGGSDGSGGSPSSGGSDASGGSNGSGGSEASGGHAGTGGSNGSGGNSGSGGSNGSGGNAGSGGGHQACPNANGFYGTIHAEGNGCGDVKTDGGVCVHGGVDACDYTLTSGPVIGMGAISGEIELKSDGTFDHASIKEGGRTWDNCTGKDVGDTLTILCGGAANQSCTLTLKRTANDCPIVP